jgi:hypothetical protein
MGLSHKRVQIAGTIDILAKRLPDVPIVYNIRSKEHPPDGCTRVAVGIDSNSITTFIALHQDDLEIRRYRPRATAGGDYALQSATRRRAARNNPTDWRSSSVD